MAKVFFNLLLIAVAYYSTVMGMILPMPSEIITGNPIGSVLEYQMTLFAMVVAAEGIIIFLVFLANALLCEQGGPFFPGYVYGFTFVLVGSTIGAFLFGTVLREMPENPGNWIATNPKTLFVLTYYPLLAWLYKSLKKVYREPRLA